MGKGRAQAGFNNHSGGVAGQFGGRNAGGASPYEFGGRNTVDHTGLDTGLDFLSRVEQAELRDKQRRPRHAAPTPHEIALSNPYAQSTEYMQVRDKHRYATSIHIGGDAPAAGYNTNDMYQTTSSKVQHEHAARLQGAHDKQAGLAKRVMEYHNISQQDIDRGGEKAKAWMKEQMDICRQQSREQSQAAPSKMATGGLSRAAPKPTGYQRSGMPMLR